MTPTIVFDVNETLLDLAPVRLWFADRFDAGVDASTWFGELLRLSFVSCAIDRYTPFPVLAQVALETVAGRAGVTIDDDDRRRAASVFTELPPHPDAVEGIRQLAAAGFMVTALTNSPPDTAAEQLENAGLASMFDDIMTVELAGRFKPHRSVYEAAARHLGIGTADMVMIAAHDWDIAGAMEAGCVGIYVNRSGHPWSRAFPAPDHSANTIIEAADWLASTRASQR